MNKICQTFWQTRQKSLDFTVVSLFSQRGRRPSPLKLQSNISLQGSHGKETGARESNGTQCNVLPRTEGFPLPFCNTIWICELGGSASPLT